MEPANSERSGLNLPSPMNEQAPASGAPMEVAPSAPEQAPRTAQNAPASSAPADAGMAPLPLPPTPTGIQSIPVNDVSNTTQINAPAIADDSDLIEKEWVNKAKQIVENTRDDPHKQSQELTVFKADYMKKRYNKTLKFSE